MDKNTHKTTPNNSQRSLQSTVFSRIVNFELYVKPNRTIMIFGIIAMLGCSGYIFYMNYNEKRNNYHVMVKSDDATVLVKKTSKWTE